MKRVLAVLALVLLSGGAGCGGPRGGGMQCVTPGGLTKLAQVTGPGLTDGYAVHGTDLGSVFTMGDRTYLVFGDTFGEGRSFWRSNAMGYTTDRDLSDGLRLDGMVTDEVGLAKELLPSKKVDGAEMTVIPTYGFAVGRSMYLHYMSVRHWGAPGHWEVNRSGLARSDDQGGTWRVLDAPTWPGDSGFAQVSVARDGDDLYFWGVPAGRFGGVRLATVPAGRVEDPSAYEYHPGLVVDDTVGELSVVRNDYADAWIMMYLKEGTGVVMRQSAEPWGPWSEPKLVVDAAEYPGLYAPFMYPGSGSRVYFNLSLWEPYNVFLFSVDLRKEKQSCESSSS